MEGTYYVGAICSKHPELLGKRRIKNRECGGCKKDRLNAWREKNREHVNSYMREYRSENSESLRVKAKEKYWNNREDRLEENRKYRVMIKNKVMTAYGGVCQVCGQSDIDVLCLDHIGGGGNEHRRSTTGGGGMKTYRWVINNNYPGGFRVLCFNCNQKAHALSFD